MAHTLTCQEVVEKVGPKDAPRAGQPGLWLSSVVTGAEEDSPPSRSVLSASADGTSRVQAALGPRQPRARRDRQSSRAGAPTSLLGTKAEVDKVEQFGTSLFKESPLKKQSLYLKVDPLPKDTP